MPRFGVAGYPPAFSASPLGKDRMRILEWLHSLGLDALELQMTYGPRTSLPRCREYRNAARDFGIRLSVHAAYFIVFTSEDHVKLHNSRETLKRTFELCDVLDADVIVLHPGPLYGLNAGDMLERFIVNLGNCLSEIGARGTSLFVETAGKIGQLGSLEEILAICRSLPGVFPCVDFGHVHARTLGSLGNDGAVLNVFEKLAGDGWFGPGKRVHFHYTPIAYGPRGELVHKTIHDRYGVPSQMDLLSSAGSVDAPEATLYMPRFAPVAEGMRRWSVECTVISETHNSQEEGAIALRDSYYGK